MGYLGPGLLTGTPILLYEEGSTIFSKKKKQGKGEDKGFYGKNKGAKTTTFLGKNRRAKPKAMYFWSFDYPSEVLEFTTGLPEMTISSNFNI